LRIEIAGGGRRRLLTFLIGSCGQEDIGWTDQVKRVHARLGYIPGVLDRKRILFMISGEPAWRAGLPTADIGWNIAGYI
jgi:hypothetical protein